MDDEADELVEVVVATGTGLSWDIPGKEEGVLVSNYALERSENAMWRIGTVWGMTSVTNDSKTQPVLTASKGLISLNDDKRKVVVDSISSIRN